MVNFRNKELKNSPLESGASDRIALQSGKFEPHLEANFLQGSHQKAVVSSPTPPGSSEI